MNLTTEDLMDLRMRVDMNGAFTKDEVYTLTEAYAPIRAGETLALQKSIASLEQRLRDERSLQLDKNDKIRQLEERVKLVTDQLQSVLGAGQYAKSA